MIQEGSSYWVRKDSFWRARRPGPGEEDTDVVVKSNVVFTTHLTPPFEREIKAKNYKKNMIGGIGNLMNISLF
jgi:hypothetical protein